VIPKRKNVSNGLWPPPKTLANWTQPTALKKGAPVYFFVVCQIQNHHFCSSSTISGGPFNLVVKKLPLPPKTHDSMPGAHHGKDKQTLHGRRGREDMKAANGLQEIEA
jgi:hypothetical protein